ncbi:MAG: hypothetical protein FWG19_03715, partial [Methanomassiliicoccaceae archaeon]|nr:hypothetical protein [Methanomassiliicoccaceae archaeon]
GGTMETVNAGKLGDIVTAPYVPGDAVLMTSGVLPDTAYDNGAPGIFEWVGDGGSLYWIGHNIGEKVASGKAVRDVPGYQINIFGTERINPSEDAQRATVRSGDPLSRALMTDHDNVRYGLDVGTPNTLSLGFEQEYGGKTYGSVTLVGIGGNGGMICVLGGWPGGTARTSISQIISSGVSNTSGLIESVNGSLVRGGAAGTLDVSAGTGTVGVQIRMGSPNIVYAGTFFF